MFLFENVKGLTSSRWTPEGEKGEIWKDVQRTFEGLDGYFIDSAIVQAKSYGVPQNRPRVLLVGIRDDIGPPSTSGGLASGLLPPAAGHPPDPIDLLGDLQDEGHATKAATAAYPSEASGETQEWFRADPRTGKIAPKGAPVTEHEYSRHAPRIAAKFRYMIQHSGEIRDQDRTKKFAQRVLPRQWPPEGPNITATSLPDDYVHFSQPRILTVREWARLQTFPDWYQFSGSRTTGGRRRAGILPAAIGTEKYLSTRRLVTPSRSGWQGRSASTSGASWTVEFEPSRSAFTEPA